MQSGSGCLAVVVPQQTAQSPVALDRPLAAADLFARRDDPIAQSLVVSGGVIVLQILPDGVAQRMLTEQNQPVEAFRFQRAVTGT
jgi:hypothetical protein